MEADPVVSVVICAAPEWPFWAAAFGAAFARCLRAQQAQARLGIH